MKDNDINVGLRCRWDPPLELLVLLLFGSLYLKDCFLTGADERLGCD